MADSKRICITVDEETLSLAGREARRFNVSRNEFIRIAVRAELEKIATEKENVSEDQSKHYG